MEIVFKKVGKSLDKYLEGPFWALMLSFHLIGIFFFMWFFALFGSDALKFYLGDTHVENLKKDIELAKSLL